MATSVTPQVIDSLIAGATAGLPADVRVLDGYEVTDAAQDFLMVGVDDPDSGAAARSAPVEQHVGTLGPPRNRDELGTVWCAAYAWNGDGDPKAARDTAFSYLAVMEDYVRDVGGEGNLGVPGVRLPQIGSHDLMQDQTDEGASALIVFSVRYLARLL